MRGVWFDRPRKWIQTLREPLLPEAVAEATEPTAAAVTTAAANKDSIAIRPLFLACSSSCVDALPPRLSEPDHLGDAPRFEDLERAALNADQRQPVENAHVIELGQVKSDDDANLSAAPPGIEDAEALLSGVGKDAWAVGPASLQASFSPSSAHACP